MLSVLPEVAETALDHDSKEYDFFMKMRTKGRHSGYVIDLINCIVSFNQRFTRGGSTILLVLVQAMRLVVRLNPCVFACNSPCVLVVRTLLFK